MGALVVLYIVGMAGILTYLRFGKAWRTTGRAVDREIRETRAMRPVPRGRV